MTLRVFRSLRSRFLAENKARRYFFYAIGEIVLVVIGILIALQIDTWNESKKQRQASRDFISRLQQEVRINIKYAREEIRTEQAQVQAARRILSLFNSPEPSGARAELDSLVFIILGNNTLEIASGTLNEGFNTGNIAIIASDSLRSALYNLPSLIEEIRKQEEIDRQDVNGHFTEFLYYNYNYRNMDNRFSRYKGTFGPTKFTSYDNLSLLESQPFENLVDNRFYNCREQLDQLEKFHAALAGIESMIEKVLDEGG